jgi:outer membrane protein, heavy metal efflux system
VRHRLRKTIAFLLVIAGCATVPPREEPAAPSPRPAVTPVASLRAPSLVPSQKGGLSTAKAPSLGLERLTLAEALTLSDRVQPELALGKAQIARAEGRALQAGLFPNPDLVARMESALLTKHLTEQAEYVVGVSQAVPLGKRLPLARRVEILDRDRLTHELAGKRLETHMRVQSAFAMALYLQRVLLAREEDVRSATNNVTLAQARLAAGDTIPAEVAQAEVELHRAELERDKATSSAAQSLKALAASIGDAALEVGSLEGALEETFAVPAFSSLEARLHESPLLSAAAADITMQRAQIDLVEAQRTPDVSVDLFYRRLGEKNENAFDVGLRLPLRLFDRGQGRRQETRAELSAAEARAQALRNELFLRAQTAHQKLERAIAAATRLRKEILPRAESVLQAAEARYHAGDTGFSELLPVRRDWTRVRLDYLEILLEVMQAWAELSPYVWQE